LNIAVISGGFDPVHSGHISLIEEASKKGNILIILLNDDDWLINKKGKAFMPFSERKKILESIKNVDQVIKNENDEHGTAINGLKEIKRRYPKDNILFCNGGDRNNNNVPEILVSGIKLLSGIGGNVKQNSSSWILKDWKYDKYDKVWGEYFDLFEDNGVKVKELIVEPNKGMSYQKHDKRSEIWLVSQGKCDIYHNQNNKDDEKLTLHKHDYFIVPVGTWHQITNPYSVVCKIIEIQYGAKCTEDDIFRRNYYEDIHTD
jgi:cytidyltransferase-like protein